MTKRIDLSKPEKKDEPPGCVAVLFNIFAVLLLLYGIIWAGSGIVHMLGWA